jgi:bleomycin hydrolase
MLATIETEHLVRGDSVNLSPVYLARQWLCEQGERYFLTQGSEPLSMRGMSTMALHLINKYGIHPYDYYHGHDDVNWNVLARRVTRLADAARSRRHSLDRFRRDLQDLLDRETGYMPRYVHMLGAEYTSQEFGHSVCMTDEYEALTSFAHHPYGERFALEVADNQLGDTFLNVPLDTLMAVVERSLRAGHPVCWEGDISNSAFSFEKGTAVLWLDKGADIQALRQQSFEGLRTTDDHAMALIGIATDKEGRRYYIAKNSWGTGNPFGGLMYLSADYLRLHTLCVVMKKMRNEK